MRRIADFQINNPRLDSVVQEVADARGDYPTLRARLDSIVLNTGALTDYKIVSAVLSEGNLVVEVNPGLAFIDDMPVLSRDRLACTIPQPAPGTVYYVYLTKAGELAYSTRALLDADKLLLGTVAVGESASGAVISDLRPFLQRGGVTGEVYDARGSYSSLGERLDAVEGAVSAVRGEVVSARGAHASLGQRLDSLDSAVSGLSFSESYVSAEGQTVFTLQHRYPVGRNKLRVFVDGLLMTEGSDADYVETDEYTVTFNYPLPAGRNVRFLVENLIPGVGFTETHTAAAGQTVFRLAYPYPAGQNRLRVYVNGLLYEPGPDNDYVETDEYTVTFNDPFYGGERVKFILESTTVTEASAAGGYTSLAHRLNSQLGDCNVDITIEYDEQGRPVREVWTGDVNKTVEFTYNERGYRASEVVTEGNLVITTTYTYNESGLVTGISVRKRLL